ncbi:unnamed protein product [Fraxinus pennsylvanica]|uniref:Uncharacterized protein n=1 Tax=Fraxinus pennsylvanica TaxID=56036 RepID=A0AAD2AJC1_9LAMI|nr:unnamed protein product [Fraxinus pennsylvanica]
MLDFIIQILQEHSNEVWFLQFSHNGDYLASSSSDCLVDYMGENKRSLRGLDTLMNQMEDLARLTCGAYHYLNHLVRLKILYPLMDLVSHGGWSLLFRSSSKLISPFISFCGLQKAFIVVLRRCSMLKEADIEWFSS